MSVAGDIIDLATQKGLRIATAESCTGGMVAASLTDIPGSSVAFERGFVTYSNAAKSELLGVTGETLEKTGAVSEETAFEMAEGARTHARVDLAVSITGIAGPGGSEFKPEGRVCFGLSMSHGTTTETIEFGAIGRAKVRAESTLHALELLKQALEFNF